MDAGEMRQHVNEELSSPGFRAVCPSGWDSCQPRLTQPARPTGPAKPPARPCSALYPKGGAAIPTQTSPSVSSNFPRHDEEAITRPERLTTSILLAEAPDMDSQFIKEGTEHFCLSQQQLCFAMFCLVQRPRDAPQIALDSSKAVASPLHPSHVPQSPLYEQSAFPASSWNTTTKPGGGGGIRKK